MRKQHSSWSVVRIGGEMPLTSPKPAYTIELRLRSRAGLESAARPSRPPARWGVFRVTSPGLRGSTRQRFSEYSLRI